MHLRKIIVRKVIWLRISIAADIHACIDLKCQSAGACRSSRATWTSLILPQSALSTR
jgi:hypothetical protein